MNTTDKPLAGLRLIVLTNWLWASSVAVITSSCCRAMRRLGADVEAWAIEDDGEVGDDLRREGFTVRILGVKRHSWRWRTSRTLIDALRSGEYDGLHAHCFEPAIHAARARAAGALRRLVVTHHDPHLTMSRRLLNLPYRKVPDAIVLASASAAAAYQRFYGFDPARMGVVPNPLPDEFFVPYGRDEAMIDQLGLRGADPLRP